MSLEPIITAAPPFGSEGKADNYSERYSNFTKISVSPWDVVISFGNYSESGSSIDIHTLMRLSPQTFKAMAISLPDILSVWEEAYGTIQMRHRAPIDKERLINALRGT
jgi:hypothetical protein